MSKSSGGQQKEGHEGGRVAVLKGGTKSGGDRSERRGSKNNTDESPKIGVSKIDNDGKGSGGR